MVTIKEAAEFSLKTLKVIQAMRPNPSDAIDRNIRDLEEALAPHRWLGMVDGDPVSCPCCREPIQLDGNGEPIEQCPQCKARFRWRGLVQDGEVSPSFWYLIEIIHERP